MRGFFATFLTLTATIYANMLPQKSYSTITAINGNSVTLSSPIGLNGESAIVVRSLANGDFATAYIMQTSNNKARLIDSDPTSGNKLATIKPILKVGDKVIGGFLYDKVIILAPNKESLSQIEATYGIKSIDPDTFAAYLAANGSSYPSASSYKKFAKLAAVGLFIIAKANSLEIYDPISQRVISKAPFTPSGNKKIKPFYNTFKDN
jgi:hypothetical protein